MANTTELAQIAADLLTPGKGLLAADESISTANEKRLARVGVEGTPENRRRFRELIFTAPGIEEYLSGIILYKETLSNRADDGTLFPELLASRGIILGVKVDEGRVPLEGFPGETITQGLDDLAERLTEYYASGTRFTKWRAAFSISDVTPSSGAIRANAVMLARFAAISQAAGMVPIVEPEVLYDGDHDLARAEEVTTRVLQTVMQILEEHSVALDGAILKTSMVLAGKESEAPSARGRRHSVPSAPPFRNGSRASCSSPADKKQYRQPRTSMRLRVPVRSPGRLRSHFRARFRCQCSRNGAAKMRTKRPLRRHCSRVAN